MNLDLYLEWQVTCAIESSLFMETQVTVVARTAIFWKIRQLILYLGLTYLRDCLSSYVPKRALCSLDYQLLVVPILKDTHLALTRIRAFSTLASAWWNSLPLEIRAP